MVKVLIKRVVGIREEVEGRMTGQLTSSGLFPLKSPSEISKPTILHCIAKLCGARPFRIVYGSLGIFKGNCISCKKLWSL